MGKHSALERQGGKKEEFQQIQHSGMVSMAYSVFNRSCNEHALKKFLDKNFLNALRVCPGGETLEHGPLRAVCDEREP